MDVATRGPSSHARQRRFIPHCSPNRTSLANHRRRELGSPARSTKKVRFDSPVPSSALKSPRKSHFRK